MAQHSKWKRSIIEVASRCLRHHSHGERLGSLVSPFRQSSCEQHDEAFHAADARRERTAINENLQRGSHLGAAASLTWSVTACSTVGSKASDRARTRSGAGGSANRWGRERLPP